MRVPAAHSTSLRSRGRLIACPVFLCDTPRLTDNTGNVRRCLLIVLMALPGLVLAQQDVFRAGPGVKPPKVTHKVKAEYTQQAFYARIQGKVVCEVVVDEKGKPVNVSVISPLGFGLDQRAVTAVRRWDFSPGTKDGTPVK